MCRTRRHDNSSTKGGRGMETCCCKVYIITEVIYYMKIDHNEDVYWNLRETTETIRQRNIANKPLEEIFNMS